MSKKGLSFGQADLQLLNLHITNFYSSSTFLTLPYDSLILFILSPSYILLLFLIIPILYPIQFPLISYPNSILFHPIIFHSDFLYKYPLLHPYKSNIFLLNFNLIQALFTCALLYSYIILIIKICFRSTTV